VASGNNLTILVIFVGLKAPFDPIKSYPHPTTRSQIFSLDPSAIPTTRPDMDWLDGRLGNTCLPSAPRVTATVSYHSGVAFLSERLELALGDASCTLLQSYPKLLTLFHRHQNPCTAVRTQPTYRVAQKWHSFFGTP